MSTTASAKQSETVTLTFSRLEFQRMLEVFLAGVWIYTGYGRRVSHLLHSAEGIIYRAAHMAGLKGVVDRISENCYIPTMRLIKRVSNEKVDVYVSAALPDRLAHHLAVIEVAQKYAGKVARRHLKSLNLEAEVSERQQIYREAIVDTEAFFEAMKAYVDSRSSEKATRVFKFPGQRGQ